MSNIGKIMKQAARLEQEMARVQQALAVKTVEGTSGGGAVKVVACCNQSIASISISPAAVNPSDVAFLEDLVLSAVNQALTKARETSDNEMKAVTKGISIPGLM